MRFTTAAIALTAPLASAQVAEWTALGAPGDTQLGYYLEVVCDLDGDGTLDVLAATTGNSPGVRLFSGRDGTLIDAIDPGLTFNFGSALGSADVDADGLCDLLVGHSWADDVYVYSGADRSLLAAVPGPGGSSFGRAVEGVGDVDGDGREDFLVGAPNELTCGFTGRAYLYSGADFTLLRTVEPPSPCGAFATGDSLAALGDVDGDGVPDHAVADALTAGVRVLSGQTGALLYAVQAAPEGDIVTDLDAVGDLGGDGVPEIAVGFGTENRVAVHDFVAGTVVHDLAPGCPGANDMFGRTVDGTGDVDGDGVPDVGVGGRYAVRVYSGADGALLHELRTDGVNNVVRGLPDWTGGARTGDGRAALVVGWADVKSGGWGRVELYSDATATPVGQVVGAGAAGCPCGNPGGGTGGCANSTGAGGELLATGSASTAATLLTFEARSLPPVTPALLVQGFGTLGAPIPLSDGLLWARPPVRRLDLTASCSDGTAFWPLGPDNPQLWSPGDTRTFQAWYRDTSGPCGTGANLTNGAEITFTP